MNRLLLLAENVEFNKFRGNAPYSAKSFENDDEEVNIFTGLKHLTSLMLVFLFCLILHAKWPMLFIKCL